MSVAPFKGQSTAAIHAGQPIDQHTGAVIGSLSLTSTFAQKGPGELFDAGFDYGRAGNPTRQSYEQCAAAVEGGKFGLAFSSGSATLVTISELLNPGDHFLCNDDVYGGTNRYLRHVAGPKGGLKVDMVDLTDLKAYKKALSKKTKVVWIETPTNPLLKVQDIEELARLAHGVSPSILVVVDNTFASPVFQRPLSLGADVVVHSVSKYINGHTDVIGGLIITNDEAVYGRLKFLQNSLGNQQAPFDSYMAMRGLKTLTVRMREHERNARAVAEFLEAHALVDKVHYPGLESHPHHATAKKQMSGYGGMVTMWLKGGLDEARTFLRTIATEKGAPWTMAESLGGVDSLLEHPALMTHASVPAEQRAELGISDSLVRLSVGIEDIDDILQGLKNAFAAIEAAGGAAAAGGDAGDGGDGGKKKKKKKSKA